MSSVHGGSATTSPSDITKPKSPDISFIHSQKRKPLLIVDEHVFKLNSATSTIKYWECTFDECSARIHTHSNGQNTCIQFNAGLGVIIKQIKTIPIQRHISNLGKRYYYGAINAMEYLDNLSFTVSQRKHENL
ncbi:unnamed protein product [Rotaria sordida]|uniref:FLYWCH-type domain-containing protein n=1 Tax=Rotaria sordida TaxID=392033 RepID=A0A813R114_9BILA|nr:unnamed protein product [Rotaria sordida]CAF0785756.1 unnamed protein product [Rotaria sordida]